MPVNLAMHGVGFRYTGIGASDRLVLDDISLNFQEKCCTALIGPSGSGKTTLIQHFTGLLKPVSGTVTVDHEDIWRKGFDMDRLRQRIGLVFQFPEAQLFEETVAEDVAFGPRNLDWPDERVAASVQRALRMVGLAPDHFSPRSPFQLSEGEKRRVAIAGVLAMEPEMIVLDEPTAGLDARGVREVESFIEELLSRGTSVVVVTHHMDFVNNIAGQVVVMNQGRIVYDGPTRALWEDEALMRRSCIEPPVFLQQKNRHLVHWPAAWRDIHSWRDLHQLLQIRPQGEMG
jgi:energy-coupling factor transport system ATP-binding protein